MVFGRSRARKGEADEADEAWADVLREAIPTRADADEVVRYLRDGTHDEPAPSIPASAQGMYSPQQIQTWADANAVARFRAIIGPHVDPLLRAVDRFPDDARLRFVDIVAGAAPPSSPGATSDQFLDAILNQAAYGAAGVLPVTLGSVEVAGSCLGYTAADMVRIGFAPTQRWRQSAVHRFGDLSPWVAEHVELIRHLLGDGAATTQYPWAIVARTDAPTLAGFAPELAVAATASSKNLRQEVRPAATRLGYTLFAPALQAVATGGDPGARARAVALLGELVHDEARDELVAWANDSCGADRSKAVREAVAALAGAGGAPSALEEPPAPIELPTLDFDAPPSEGATRILEASSRQDRRAGPDGATATLLAVMAGRYTAGNRYYVGQLVDWAPRVPELLDELTVVHVARMLLVSSNTLNWLTSWPGLIEPTGHPTPLELQAVAVHDDVPPAQVMEIVSWAFDVGGRTVWPASDVAAWLAANTDLVLSTLAGTARVGNYSRAGLIRSLGTLDHRPARLDEVLLAVALVGTKADQPLVRALFGPDVADRVIPYLASSKVAERMGAATWLRDLSAPQAEDALRTAIAKEKQDGAKAQLMAALEALGVSLDEFLGPDTLLADAKAALAKKNAVPKALDWLAIDSLPEVRWADGSVVDPVILRWFVAVATKAKTAEPSPLLRRHVASMDPDDVRRFGEALFESWVSEDLRPRPYTECEAQARQGVRTKIGYANRYPDAEWYAEYRGLTEDEAVALDLPALLAQPAGSANDSKGLLAVVAATGGPELAPRVHAYLKKWRGNRLSQGKAMLEMLAWTETPPAIQVVLTVGQRFRPRGLQEAAAQQAELLAARRGWTVEDLADRTVPRGGFDDDGRLVIDYGTRTFTALLRDDLTVELTNDETGRSIASLPAPRKDEDEAEVKAIQKELAAAKKEIKATAKLQPQRLHQAMCLQRAWSADDFGRYIVAHPVMRRLAQRLVWAAGDVQFRPTADGALIDLDDDEVVLDEAAQVTIAHDEVVGPEAAASWIVHLADYEVTPLFAQFDRPPLPADLDATLIKDFEGHMISALSIRGLANKHAWQLGAAADAGIISSVHKDFPGGNLQAVFEFTGMPATTEEWPVAWQSLYVARPGAWVNEQQARPLHEVPPILLREIYAEAQAMAAAGTGYADDWRKQVGW